MFHNFLNLFNGGMAMVSPAVLAMCHVYYDKALEYSAGIMMFRCE